MESNLEADTPIERTPSLKSKIGRFPAFFWEGGRKLVPGYRASESTEDQAANTNLLLERFPIQIKSGMLVTGRSTARSLIRLPLQTGPM